MKQKILIVILEIIGIIGALILSAFAVKWIWGSSLPEWFKFWLIS